ncbi:DUF3047 domain-containing protein [Roseovarius aquimarinus]|uniref:DUF3047 domain-containing protein n=1 Tax=Roseovarius aquimarinus TaxID=1229156 RepID=A0ABW7IAU6_9RHOB
MIKARLLCAALLLPLPAMAGPLGGWTEQKFSLFSGNDWRQGSDSVAVRSNDTVSMLWTTLPEAEWSSTGASWSWSVDQSVPATDLARKGGDDRNLSLYFVFMPEEIARQNVNSGIRQLLDVEEARVLMYVWGGNAQRGALLGSPYLGGQGKTVVLRGAGTGAHSERVDLAADYRRAFGGAPTSLVGLALSADSDDTNGAIAASLSGLTLN